MKFPQGLIITNSYFFVFALGIVVFFDLLIRFKTPIQLKLHFLLIVLFTTISAFFSYNMTGPDQYILVIKVMKFLAGASFIQIFTILYFIKYKKLANIHLAASYTFYIFFIFYVQHVGYDQIFLKSGLITNTVDGREFRLNAPIYIGIFVYIFFIIFNIFSMYYLYNIIFKIKYNNIYYIRIKQWSISFFMLFASQIILFISSLIFDIPNIYKTVYSIAAMSVLLLIILYRPSFINNNGQKISLGSMFNKIDFTMDIKENDFNFHFFNKLYFKNRSADINDFSNIMGVSKEIMFNYVYFNYSMSFDELVAKSRVEYFVDIIKLPKYKNYTVEALALEVGFSSRQRFYQPFKKYHGGNPSDLIDIF